MAWYCTPAVCPQLYARYPFTAMLPIAVTVASRIHVTCPQPESEIICKKPFTIPIISCDQNMKQFCKHHYNASKLRLIFSCLLPQMLCTVKQIQDYGIIFRDKRELGSLPCEEGQQFCSLKQTSCQNHSQPQYWMHYFLTLTSYDNPNPKPTLHDTSQPRLNPG